MRVESFENKNIYKRVGDRSEPLNSWVVQKRQQKWEYIQTRMFSCFKHKSEKKVEQGMRKQPENNKIAELSSFFKSLESVFKIFFCLIVPNNAFSTMSW